jgi:hypothetical protein
MDGGKTGELVDKIARAGLEFVDKLVVRSRDAP